MGESSCNIKKGGYRNTENGKEGGFALDRQ